MARRIKRRAKSGIGLLLWALLAPAVATAAPATGSLNVASGIAFNGPADFSSEGETALLVFRNLTDASTFEIKAEEATVEYHTERSILTAPLRSPVPTPIGNSFEYQHTTEKPPPTEHAMANAQIRISPQESMGLYVATYPLEETGASYGLELESQNPITMEAKEPGTVSFRRVIGAPGDWPAYAFRYEYDRPHLLMQPDHGAVNLSGDFALYVWNATVSVSGSEGALDHETGEFYSNDTGATKEVKQAWVIATFRGATLTYRGALSDIDPPPQALIYADFLTAATSSQVSVTDARGAFRTSDYKGTYLYSANGKDAFLRGDLELQLSALAPSGTLAAVSGDPPRLRVGISGDLTRTNLPRQAVGGLAATANEPAVLAVGVASLLGVVLWHRVTRKRVFKNHSRLAIFQAIQEQPGVRAGTLARQFGLNYNTASQHLRTLERLDMIQGSGTGQRRYFVNGGTYNNQEKAQLVAASAPNAKAVLDHLKARGETPLSDLCDALGLSRYATSRAVKRLEKAGLLTKRRQGKRLLVAPAPSPGPGAEHSP